MNEALKMLESEDANSIYAFFDGAKEFRDSLPVHQGGAIPSFTICLLMYLTIQVLSLR